MPPSASGLGLYPSIRKLLRRVVVLIVPRTCEMLHDFTRFHENARLYDCSHEVNHHKNRKNDKNKK